MSNIAVPFPSETPVGYEWLVDEPAFDPKKHLALEKPETTISLADLGYSEAVIKTKASTVAASSPFRVLSAEGARVLLHVARKLRHHAISCERIENMVRGGCYRSKFLRDLCIDESVNDLMCEIYKVDVAPHTMPVHLGHMNFSPTNLDKAVDKWHHDTLPLDYVMMVSDPKSLSGGEFQYFLGTKDEVAQITSRGETLPQDRIISPNFSGPGYAIALHGDMVVHRGAPLLAPGERISMVNGYVAMDTSGDDQHRHIDLTLVDDPQCLYAEWAKHSVWRAKSRLNRLLDTIEFSSDYQNIADQLENAICDVTDTIEEMRNHDNHEMHHYEKSK